MADIDENSKYIEKALDNINAGTDAILQQYHTVPKKEQTKLINELKKDSKRLAKEWVKTQQPMLNWKIKANNESIRRLKASFERIDINYGFINFSYNVKWFMRQKDKEKTLDKSFNVRMIKILNEYPAPKSIRQAKALEGLITQYNKKVREREFYNDNVVQNSINKLASFRNSLTTYEYSDYIQYLMFLRENKGSEEELLLEFNKDREEKNQVNNKLYKAIEQAVLLYDWLMGIRYNFF